VPKYFADLPAERVRRERPFAACVAASAVAVAQAPVGIAQGGRFGDRDRERGARRALCLAP